MKVPTIPLTPGLYRPVYLWAGPGTVRMNRLKFMGAAVDEEVHQEAHTAIGAKRMAEEAGFNWAYLMYDWGFPPEIEEEDWQAFRDAVQVYHAAGMRVSGYIQVSNCVYTGSYQEKDWYAQDPYGRPFYYYTGRYMTCWSHPQWLAHLEEMVSGVLESDADGVFFDNLWHACQPLHLGGAWLGPAGCYCPRCRQSFRQDTDMEIPADLSPANNPASREYLRWRMAQVTQTLGRLAREARRLKPGVIVSANNFDAVMRPSARVYGIDLTALAEIQDILMIEDYGLPRWELGAALSMREQESPLRQAPPLLVNNALTLRTAAAMAGRTPMSTNPYDQGIGFDAVYPARRFLQGMAEAAACGASMVVKGTEFFERGQFTLLTAEKFIEQRIAIGGYHRWLEEHADLYQSRKNAARVGLLCPSDALWQDWDRLAPIYFGAGQTLIAAGIPWRVIVTDDLGMDLDILLTFEMNGTTSPHFDREQAKSRQPAGDLHSSSVPPSTRNRPALRINVPDLPGWAPPSPSLLARHPRLGSLAGIVTGEVFQAYFRWRWARRLADHLKLARAFTQSPLFYLPSQASRASLLTALGELPFPRIISSTPVLAETWEQSNGIKQLHLVNYADQPQEVQVAFDRLAKGRNLSPDSPANDFHGDSLRVRLEIYTVLEYA